MAYEDFALNLDESKLSMVHRRLWPRLRVLDMSSFEQYLSVLEQDKDERDQLMSLLTTNLTSFFRERHHFEILQEYCLPGLIERARKGGRVRIWSAGCSSGQEPYSLAMSVLEACPEAGSLDIKLLGTDIDQNVISIARGGLYTAHDVDGIEDALVAKYFDAEGDGLRVKQAVQSLVSFGQLNLIESWPFSGKFDVIFCRNVAIYFDATTQDTLWKRFLSVMPKGALLCIGHSERVSPETNERFNSLGKTAYEVL